jgi:hypothetical protein
MGAAQTKVQDKSNELSAISSVYSNGVIFAGHGHTDAMALKRSLAKSRQQEQIDPGAQSHHPILLQQVERGSQPPLPRVVTCP